MRFTLLVVAVLLVLVGGGAAIAAEANHDWGELMRRVKTGQDLDVTVAGGAHFLGRLQSITEESLVLDDKGTPRQLSRLKVHRVRPTVHRGKRILICALAAAGGTAAVWAGVEDRFKTEAAAFGGLFGFAGGAITGAALTFSPPLYEAQTAALGR